MKSLENYSKLTIRISKVKVFTHRNGGDGYGYRFFFRCDEIPECSGYAVTVSNALGVFQKMAKLWINLVR
jgi:hypothetical protein